MNCFTHREASAVGICQVCGKGICGDCAVDLERGLACKDRCEVEARRLIDLRDFSFSQPSVQSDMLAKQRRSRWASTTLFGTLGIVFLVAGYFTGDFALTIIGILEVVLALYFFLSQRVRVNLQQFRLCPECGYNMTGNTTGKCPECGFLA